MNRAKTFLKGFEAWIKGHVFRKCSWGAFNGMKLSRNVDLQVSSWLTYINGHVTCHVVKNLKSRKLANL